MLACGAILVGSASISSGFSPGWWAAARPSSSLGEPSSRFFSRSVAGRPAGSTWHSCCFLFALIPLTVNPAPSGPVGAALWYWSFYAALLALALWAGRELPWQVLAGLVLAAWMVGNPSEFVGSVVSRFWIFTDHPRYPPIYLLAGCWPLEIVAQYVLSGWLAGEPLSGESAPPASGLEQARRAFRQLRVFLVGGGLAYLGVGLLFAIAPDGVLRALNYLSRILTPGLALAGLPRERFWVALAFSMMMTIAMLSFCAASALHRNRGYVAALLMAKATSTLCSLWYFLMPAHHQLASLFIVLVDGTLFSLTLYFFLRAFLRAQTGYYYGELPPRPAPVRPRWRPTEAKIRRT